MCIEDAPFFREEKPNSYFNYNSFFKFFWLKAKINGFKAIFMQLNPDLSLIKA